MNNEELKKQIAEDAALHITDVLNRFSENQTLSIVGRLRNLGVGLKILKNNKWEPLHEYKLPFDRFIPLYDDNFKICDIGVY
jgi:hypothetical protein